MATKVYVASRISEGNRLFPAEIHIEDTEIMLKFPGFFSGKSRHIVYQQIEGVNIDTPMIGYSTITFVVGGEKLVGHGFTEDDVTEIKQICTEKIRLTNPANSLANAISSSSSKTVQISIADELRKLKDLLDIGVITQPEFEKQKSKLLNS